MAKEARDLTRKQQPENEWASWAMQNTGAGKDVGARYRYTNLTPNLGVLELSQVRLGDRFKRIETLEFRFRPNGYAEPIYLDLLLPDAPAYVVPNDREPNARAVLEREFSFLTEFHERSTRRSTFPRVRRAEATAPRDGFHMQTLPGDPLDDFFRDLPYSPQRDLIELIVLHNALAELQSIHGEQAVHGDARFPNLLVNPRDFSVRVVDAGNAHFPAKEGRPAEAGYQSDHVDFTKGVYTEQSMSHLRALRYDSDEPITLEIVRAKLAKVLGEKGYTVADLPTVQVQLARNYFKNRLREAILFGTNGRVSYGNRELEELITAIDQVCTYARNHPESFASDEIEEYPYENLRRKDIVISGV